MEVIEVSSKRQIGSEGQETSADTSKDLVSGAWRELSKGKRNLGTVCEDQFERQVWLDSDP